MTEIIDSQEKEPEMTVGIVIFKKDEVLLVKHGESSGHINGVYGLPAGRLKIGESLLEAAIREFNEETGLSAKSANFVQFPGNIFSAKMPRKNGKIEEYGWTVFKVSDYEGELREGDNEVTPMWFSMETVKQIDQEGKLLPNVIAAIEAAKNV